MDLQGKKVLIIGMARSGMASATFLHQKGAQVTITDLKTRQAAGSVADQLEAQGIGLHLGGYPQLSPGSYDMVVPSPGVPMETPPVLQALELGIPVIGEMELAYQFAHSPIVAITGTNGKTTTTTLVGELFRNAGITTLVGGNIGLPLVTEVEKYGPKAVIVAEVSSFQLETIQNFRPRVAMILNLTPDHLDRHKTMEGYGGAKARIFENQQPSDFTVLNYDDPAVRAMADRCSGQVIFFSRQHKLDAGVYVQDGQVVINHQGKLVAVLDTKDIGIIGAHNLENALAATAAAFVMGIGVEVIAQTLQTFSGVAHRLEFVRELAGVRYINDSKGTNPDATIKALEAFTQPVVLIAGGKNKGSDFDDLAVLIKERVKVLVLVGEAAEVIEAAVLRQNFADIKHADSFVQGITLAAESAADGDVVLLSPACASWDMFNNFEERGDLFKQVVNNLRG